jgi:hypothetical protein
MALLRAIVGSDQTLSAWIRDNPPTEADLSWLAARDLAAYALQRIYQADLAGQIPPDVRKVARQLSARGLLDAELRARELGQVLDALAKAQITPVLFKGAVLAHTVYPTPACRPMGDLDLWLTEAEMARGQAALVDLGYAQRVKTRRPVALQAQRSGEIQMIGPAPRSGLVELHYGVFAGEWLRQATHVDERGVRERLATITILGRPAGALAVEDSLIQLAVHLTINHQMAHPGVRGLLDIVLEARTRMPDWALLVARAQEWRVATAVWLALHLVVELLGFEEARPACASLAPSAARQLLIRRFVTPRSVLAQRDLTRHGAIRFMYQMLLVDRLRDGARLLGRALWPEDAWLAARYGRQGFWQRWQHIWAVVRARV